MVTKTIKVDTLARVEGEGALYIRFEDGTLEEVRLEIFEPPRYFEAFLRGRRCDEAPDITARICGICPVAYQMSAVHAMERALDLTCPPGIRELRRLLYCGEWIESHTLHVYMLHAPDFLNYESGIHMAKDHPEIVRRGLEMKKIGNQIVTIVGGREIHPVNVRVGGFYRAPGTQDFAMLRERLAWALEAAAETIEWTSHLPCPEMQVDYEFVSLRHPDEYPMNEGRLVSSNGLDIDPSEFLDHFEETHVEHSNALHCRLRGQESYLVGPLARYALNHDRLSAQARELARRAGLEPICRNPFKSIVVRSVEIYHAIETALKILDEYRQPEKAYTELTARAGIGHAVTEAPRGLLYHRYELDDAAVIREARIIPPTSQNQRRIEQDLFDFISASTHLEDDELKRQSEQIIRNHDPCISCATHFLKLTVDRRLTPS